MSYARTDEWLARRLLDDLGRSRRPRLAAADHVVPEPGESYEAARARTIRAADLFVAIVSPGYVADRLASTELDDALRRQREGDGPMVAAARVGDIRTPWDDHPGVAWSEDAGPACVRLVVRLANHPSSAAAGPRAAGGVPSPAPMDGAQDAPFLPADGCDGGHCFVVMPFGDRTLDTVYRTCVKRVLSDVCGIECTRGDDLFGSGGVVDTLVAKIAGARLVVADLTRRNPNVFYEVGIAHALRRPVLLLAQSMDDVPFDLKHRHVVIYEPTRAGRTRLRQTLGPRVEQFLLPSGPGADSMGVLS